MKAINEGDLDGKTPNGKHCRKTVTHNLSILSTVLYFVADKSDTVGLHTLVLLVVACVRMSEKISMLWGRVFDRKLHFFSVLWLGIYAASQQWCLQRTAGIIHNQKQDIKMQEEIFEVDQ